MCLLTRTLTLTLTLTPRVRLCGGRPRVPSQAANATHRTTTDHTAPIAHSPGLSSRDRPTHTQATPFGSVRLSLARVEPEPRALLPNRRTYPTHKALTRRRPAPRGMLALAYDVPSVPSPRPLPTPVCSKSRRGGRSVEQGVRTRRDCIMCGAPEHSASRRPRASSPSPLQGIAQCLGHTSRRRRASRSAARWRLVHRCFVDVHHNA